MNEKENILANVNVCFMFLEWKLQLVYIIGLARKKLLGEKQSN